MLTAQFILFLIFIFIAIEFILGNVLDFLNQRNWKDSLPNQLSEFYTPEAYDKAARYHKAKGNLGLIQQILMTVLLVVILYFGWFGSLDQYAEQLVGNGFLNTLLFLFILIIGMDLIGLPFSIKNTFGIEEEFGFNKTTPKTFALDKIKGLFLTAIIGGGLLSFIYWIYIQIPDHFWWLAWLVLSIFSIVMATLYTSLLLPIFNKLEPLPDGTLKSEIADMAQSMDFPMQKISIMDGSKRSSKANAFFTGLGSQKSIVLFDTLVNEYSNEEILAVLSHEIGHYKNKHIIKNIFLSLTSSFITFFLLGLVLEHPVFCEALGFTSIKFHGAMLCFGLLYSPISTILGILTNKISRIFEFEADSFAAIHGHGKALVQSLKKLSVDQLSHLLPHKAYVFVHYSHPPMLQRMVHILKESK